MVLRALIASAIFFVFLLVIAGDPPGRAVVFTAALFVIMLPLGLLLDRISHRIAMRRWEKRRAGG